MNIVSYELWTLFHVSYEPCFMLAMNRVSCELLTVFHMSYELRFMWDTNFVSCELRTVFHVSYEPCFIWATNCVSCDLRTLLHVNYDLVSYNLDKFQPSKFSFKKFWSQGVTGSLLLKKNRNIFWIVCSFGMWFLSKYTKTYSLRRLTSLS